MNVQKINFYQNPIFSSSPNKKPSLSSKSQDSFEAEPKKKDYNYNTQRKYYEQIGDFCIENKEYDAALHYYGNAIKEIKRYLADNKDSLSNGVYRQEVEAINTYNKKYDKYCKEMERYQKLPLIKKIFLEEPTRPKTIKVSYEISEFNRNVLILSNLYKKVSMIFYLQGEDDKVEEYSKIAKEIPKKDIVELYQFI